MFVQEIGLIVKASNWRTGLSIYISELKHIPIFNISPKPCVEESISL